MKITKDYLRDLIRESISEELDETEEVNEMFGLSQGVSDVVTGNFVYDGIQIIGALLISLLGVGAVKVMQIKQDLDQKAREKVIDQRKADAAKRVADLVEKYKSNAELMELLKAKKMKLFSQKLSELEKASSGRGVGPNLGSDVYKASKKQAGM